MYSPNVVMRNVARVEQGLAIRLHPYSIDDSVAITEHLQTLVSDGRLKRPLKAEERAFIRNERLLCKLDFRYFCERYAFIHLDGAVGLGIGRPHFWESQELTLALIARVEEESHALLDAGDPGNAICVCQHKSRQLGATVMARLMASHRITFWGYTRGMAASLDETKVYDQLYSKDKLIHDNLPWFLKPRLKFDVKNRHIATEAIGSYIMYQQANQESGIGQGSQFDVSHLTEVASWPYPKMIELDFIPTIPQSPYAFCILESTAQGRGDWWHEFTDAVRLGRMYGWHYCFWPWYVNKSKYRAKPPDEWRPSKLSELHAAKVSETSPTFLGHRVDLSREQLFWYEMKYANAREKGELNLFLMNYSVTPEQSFQFSNQGAFPMELLDELALRTASGVSYEFRRLQ